MLRIPADKWNRLYRIAGIVAIPAVAIIVFLPAFPGSFILKFLAYLWVIGFALSSALVAIAQRLGLAEFIWDEKSKRSLFYRMKQLQGQMRNQGKDPQ